MLLSLSLVSQHEGGIKFRILTRAKQRIKTFKYSLVVHCIITPKKKVVHLYKYLIAFNLWVRMKCVEKREKSINLGSGAMITSYTLGT